MCKLGLQTFWSQSEICKDVERYELILSNCERHQVFLIKFILILRHWLKFTLIWYHTGIFYDFYQFWPPHIFASCTLIFGESISETIELCRIKVWVYLTCANIDENPLIHSNCERLQKTERPTNTEQLGLNGELSSLIQ